MLYVTLNLIFYINKIMKKLESTLIYETFLQVFHEI